VTGEQAGRSQDDDLIQRRKAEHLRVTAGGDVDSRVGPGWSDIHLVHEAVPATNLDAVDLRATFLGHHLRAPLLIAGMTGGHAAAAEINACLARAAERHGLAMGVGSQRAALPVPALAATYAIARQNAPTAFLIGNLGAPQLIAQGDAPALSIDDVRSLVDSIRANALAIHLNFLQETVQPEGDRRARGILPALAALVGQVGVPVIAKETGAGLARQSARRLAEAGVAALDVGGVGGTSFAAVEGQRAAARGNDRARRLGETFRDWGVPTAVAIAACRPLGLPIVATGGVRSGLDAAKALALGATLVGVARPLLEAALAGGDVAVDSWIEAFLAELRAAIFLSGARGVADLPRLPRVILGDTHAWLSQLGWLEDAGARKG
jgi:isopentenyl-diphosphate delta-isomerase